jgi:cupin fold WbuC family metalloprotein
MAVRTKTLGPEVLIAEGPLVQLSRSDIEIMKRKAPENERARIRLCAHASIEDRLHEMFIVHQRGTYIRPHKHLNKSESAHIIEGSVTWVVFDEAGNVTHAIRMGDYRSGDDFYYRMSGPYYHTLLIHSEWVVFHEITNGPFDRKETVYAPWAPKDADRVLQETFLNQVASTAQRLASVAPQHRHCAQIR